MGALYRAARASRDINAVSKGRVGRRVANKAIGRVGARSGFWSALWGGGRR